MDVVVVDVPPRLDMLFSISWASKLKGTFQMDLSYTTIPVFGEKIRLYRENRLAYSINNKENPENHQIYSIDIDMGSSMLFNDLCSQRIELEPSKSSKGEENQQYAEAKQEHQHGDLSPPPKDTEEG
jgi:hypothetical protein